MTTEAMAPRVDERNARPLWRAIVQVVSWLLIAVAAFFLWPASLGGGTSIVIVSGESMYPTYDSGDLVIARKGDPAIGDVIVYAPENLGGAQVVHRIIGGDAETGWQLQGDNNDFVDPFTPTGSEVRGIVAWHVPHFGAVTSLLVAPWVWLFLIMIAVALLMWPQRCEEPDDASSEATPEGSEAEHTGAADAQQASGQGRSA